jgi:hypothetical protein
MKAKAVTIDGVEIYPTGAILGKALEPLQKRGGARRKPGRPVSFAHV